MKGLIYQLKSVRKDKFCIMSFLLPIRVLSIRIEKKVNYFYEVTTSD